jgi:hypothetical protein
MLDDTCVAGGLLAARRAFGIPHACSFVDDVTRGSVTFNCLLLAGVCCGGSESRRHCSRTLHRAQVWSFTVLQCMLIQLATRLHKLEMTWTLSHSSDGYIS